MTGDMPIDALNLDDFLFVGFNRRVIALDKRTGEILWKWKASHGSGFVSLLVEDDRLYVSVNGYTYCLDAVTGAEIWYNALSGLGVGVACLATTRAATHHALLGEAAAEAVRAGANGGAAGASSAGG